MQLSTLAIYNCTVHTSDDKFTWSIKLSRVSPYMTINTVLERDYTHGPYIGYFLPIPSTTQTNFLVSVTLTDKLGGELKSRSARVKRNIDITYLKVNIQVIPDANNMSQYASK